MITTEPLFLQSPVATSILDPMGQRVARNEAYRSLIDPDAATPSSTRFDAPAPSPAALASLLAGDVLALVAEHPAPRGDGCGWLRSTTVVVTDRDGSTWFVQTTVELTRWTPVAPSRRWDDLEIDDEARTARVAGLDVHPTPTEFELLAGLFEHPGAIRSRRELADRAWGHDWDGDDHVVDVHIANLRKKIDLDGRRHIKTVRGSGYRLA